MSLFLTVLYALALPLAAQAAPGAPVVAAPPPPPAVAPPPRKSGKLLSPTPANAPGSWVTTGDYPIEALRDGLQGATGFRLLIGPDGTVRDCLVTLSSGAPQLDAATCTLVRQRAQFYPGTDDRGRPALGTYSNKVRWVIPHDGPAPAAGLLVRSFDILPDGTMTACRIDSVSGSAALSARVGPEACVTNRRFEPPLDAAGQPVTRHVTQTLEIRVSDGT